jgi:hypothetical protein
MPEESEPEQSTSRRQMLRRGAKLVYVAPVILAVSPVAPAFAVSNGQPRRPGPTQGGVPEQGPPGSSPAAAATEPAAVTTATPPPLPAATPTATSSLTATPPFTIAVESAGPPVKRDPPPTPPQIFTSVYATPSAQPILPPTLPRTGIAPVGDSARGVGWKLAAAGLATALVPAVLRSRRARTGDRRELSPRMCPAEVNSDRDVSTLGSLADEPRGEN